MSFCGYGDAPLTRGSIDPSADARSSMVALASPGGRTVTMGSIVWFRTSTRPDVSSAGLSVGNARGGAADIAVEGGAAVS